MLNNKEPVMWAQPQQVVVDARRRGGRANAEKRPARGFHGEPGVTPLVEAKFVRYVPVIRHDGHRINLVLTNAAAHQDHNEEFGQMRRAKARYYGWFSIADCPLALIRTGELESDHLADQSLLGQAPCEHGTQRPCPHALAEEKARQEENARDNAKREANFQSEADKIVGATQQQTTALIDRMEKRDEQLGQLLQVALEKKGAK